jgi:hypothetical protein
MRVGYGASAACLRSNIPAAASSQPLPPLPPCPPPVFVDALHSTELGTAGAACCICMSLADKGIELTYMRETHHGRQRVVALNFERATSRRHSLHQPPSTARLQQLPQHRMVPHDCVILYPSLES